MASSSSLTVFPQGPIYCIQPCERALSRPAARQISERWSSALSASNTTSTQARPLSKLPTPSPVLLSFFAARLFRPRSTSYRILFSLVSLCTLRSHSRACSWAASLTIPTSAFPFDQPDKSIHCGRLLACNLGATAPRTAARFCRHHGGSERTFRLRRPHSGR